MKYPIVCLAAIAIASPSFAVTLGTAPAVTIALTASSITGGFRVTDPNTGEVYYENYKSTDGKPDKNGNVVTTVEYKTIAQVVRFGNVELLNDLLEAGSIPDGTVKGWSIVRAGELDGVDVNGQSMYHVDAQSMLYAVKKGQAPILIEAEVSDGNEAVAIVGKLTTSSSNPDVASAVSLTATSKAVRGLSYKGFEVQGVETGSTKYSKGTFGKDSSAIPYETELDGAGKIAGISGNYTSVDEGISAVVEGTISTAAESVLDLETLGFGQ